MVVMCSSGWCRCNQPTVPSDVLCNQWCQGLKSRLKSLGLSYQSFGSTLIKDSKYKLESIAVSHKLIVLYLTARLIAVSHSHPLYLTVIGTAVSHSTRPTVSHRRWVTQQADRLYPTLYHTADCELQYRIDQRIRSR